MLKDYEIYHLPNESKEEIANAMREMAGLRILSAREGNPQLFLEAQSLCARRLHYALPEEVRTKLAQFVAGEVDYFVLRNSLLTLT